MKLLRKFSALFRRRQLDAEMAEELRAHVEEQTERNLAAGMTPDEARYAARRQFGGVERIKEQVREQRGLPWLENVLRDVRLGARMLRRNPGFATVAVLTLALGIGACTAIFTVVNATLLRPPDYFESERIVILREVSPPPSARENPVSAPNFLDWQRRATSFTSMAAYTNAAVNFTGGDEPRQLAGVKVTGRFFDVFGLRPALGRVIAPADDQAGSQHVAVLSFPFWQRAFGGAADVVGRTLQLDGEEYTVIGVAAATPGHTDLWLPMAFTTEQTAEDNRGAHWLNVAARLKPGVSAVQAAAEMKVIAAQLGDTAANDRWGAQVVPLLDYSVRDGRTGLLVLFGTVICLLLIACVNVSNLLLARATARLKEISIRAALGAGRARLVGQLLTESLLLSALGGALGVVLGRGMLRIAAIFSPMGSNAVALDGRVLAFALAVSLATGLLFGLAPAWLGARAGMNEALKQNARGMTENGSLRRLRGGLIVGELAATVMLLALAGLLGRSFVALVRDDPGFVPDQATVLRLTLPQKKYPRPEQQAAFTDALLARVRSLPGVVAAGAAHIMPMMGGQTNGFTIQGRPVPERLPVTSYFAVTPDYFPAMGIRLRRGRLFEEKDDARAPRVALINETLARQQFPNENPIGQRINFTTDNGDWSEIVGVVADVAQNALDRTVPPQAYEPFAQVPRLGFYVVVRAAAGENSAAVSATLPRGLRAAVRAVDPDQPLGNIAALGEVLNGGMARQRFLLLLLAAFSLLALLIAAVGLYGVMAYDVAQRTSEFGIRLALGARPADLLRLVLIRGGWFVAGGLVLGLALTVAGSGVIRSMLFHTPGYDPATLGGIALLLSFVALLACWLPARRAAKIDPLVALRTE
ncbi:MAG TPA: ABC transporter permease [Opitutaceae bacterium]|nr:ABC transporter permease [Opitutaceae bacterium]